MKFELDIDRRNISDEMFLQGAFIRPQRFDASEAGGPHP
jgi:hypothetical protein